MTKVLSATFLFCFTTLFAFSQAPGYQGLTLGVYYEGFVLSAMNRPNANFQSANLFTYEGDRNTNLFALNYRHSVGVEYTISRKQNIGAAFHFYTSSVYLDEEFEYEERPFSRRNSADVTGLEEYAGIKGKNYELFYKKSVQEFIAPIGGYLKFSLMAMTTNVLIDNPIITEAYTNNGQQDIEVEFPDTRFFYPGLALEGGGMRVIFDRIELRYGMQFAWVGANIFYNLTPIEFENYLKHATGNRIFHMHLFNLKLGVGFLAI
ncbi:MAG: hypothetical protein WD077_10195 [Bacteroidia bacterium]